MSYEYDDYGDIYSGDGFSLPEDFTLGLGSLGDNANLGLNFDWGDLTNLVSDPKLFAAFAELNPDDAALLKDLVGSNVSGGNLEEDYVVDDKGNVVSTHSGQTMPGSGQSNITQRGSQGLFDKIGQGIKDLTGISGTDALKYAAMIAAAKMAKDDAEAARKEARGAAFKSKAPVTATRQAYKGTTYAAQGGLMGLAQGGKTSLPPRYLDGHTDGMEDKVPAQIDNRRPAALSDGEFVIPADVVSHLGNGNSSAGAKRLYEMMDRIRHARTGNPKQGKQINPDKFLPR